MTTSPTKQKKPTLKEQLAIEQANSKKLAIELDESRKITLEKQQEITNVFNTKNKEMKELLEALLRPLGMHNPSPLYGTQSQTTVPQLAGMVASGIAQLAEKVNLQNTIIQEQDDQIVWFRELVEKVLGIKKPKVDTEAIKEPLPPKPPRRGSLS